MPTRCELLPERLRDLIDRSLGAARPGAPARRHDALAVAERAQNNAVERQLGLLKAAFEREAR